MRENSFRTRLRAGERLVNGWLSTGDPLLAETMAHAGFDALTLDMQHGVADAADALRVFQAVSTTPTVPMVRVPWNDPATIMKVLDIGAYGVICPMIEGRADGEAFVRSCRYPPDGNRSFGPVRGLLYGGGDYATRANDTVMAIAMIETRSALEQLDDILTVSGLDAIFVGPADLSQALGGPAGTDWSDGPVPAALDTILERCAAHGVPAGIFTKSPAYARTMHERGFAFVTVGSDLGYVATGAREVLEQVRATS